MARLAGPPRRKTQTTKHREIAERHRWALALSDVVPPARLRRLFGLPRGCSLRPQDGKKRWFPVYGYTKGERIVALWNAGATYQEIGSYLAVTKNYIGATLGRAKGHGLEVRKGYRFGRTPEGRERAA